MAKPQDKTVLVVDDEADVREYLSMVLEDAGFNVSAASDGNEAIAKVEANQPDFISLDLVMPGKSGIKFLYELRHNKNWSEIPFVIVTAHANDELGKEDLKDILSNKTFSGPGIYLEKPVKPEQYIRFICDELGVDYSLANIDDGTNKLRNEIQELMKDADPEKLAQALKALKK